MKNTSKMDDVKNGDDLKKEDDPSFQLRPQLAEKAAPASK